MSTLNPLFEGLAKSVRHHAARYRLEQPRLAPLAAYPDVASLAKALAPDSPLDKEIRATIVLALVELQGAAPHQLWSTLFALAFAPMLRRLRKRIGRPRDEDLDQKVFLEFIDATTRVPPTTRSWHVAICLRRETEHRVFDHVRRHLETPALEEFDDDHDVIWTMGEMLDRRGADRLEEALDEIPNPETRESWPPPSSKSRSASTSSGCSPSCRSPSRWQRPRGCDASGATRLRSSRRESARRGSGWRTRRWREGLPAQGSKLTEQATVVGPDPLLGQSPLIVFLLCTREERVSEPRETERWQGGRPTRAPAPRRRPTPPARRDRAVMKCVLKDGSRGARVVGAEGHVLPGLDLSPLHVELHANAS